MRPRETTPVDGPLGGPADGISNPPGETTECGCHGSCDLPSSGLNRRTFVQSIGAGTALAAWQASMSTFAGPFDSQDTVDHFVPADKKLASDWVSALFAKGTRAWYSGDELETIGMPVGGVCAGQVYLTGDGRLVYWDIFNSNHNTGYGRANYRAGRKPTDVVSGSGDFIKAIDVDQGVALQVTTDGQTVTRNLDAGGFPAVRFCGEYPCGYVEFSDPALPVQVRLEAFSPFIPLNAADSALPATVLNYTLKNNGSSTTQVALLGWLQNAVLLQGAEQFVGQAVRSNHVLRQSGLTVVSAEIEPLPQAEKTPRPPIVFADFEGADYGDWTVEGAAFGHGPATGTLENQTKVTGFQGQALVNTYLGGDDQRQGKLRSPNFTIDRPWISFLIGGGGHANKTCINLVMDDQVVRTAMGSNREDLDPHNWNVTDLAGREARFEIVDAVSQAWGHINIDQIEFRDTPMAADERALQRRPDYGTMALTVLGDKGTFADASLPEGDDPETLFTHQVLGGDERVLGGDERVLGGNERAEKPLDQLLRGAVGQTVVLKPGAEATITLVVSWHMPNNYRDNHRVGNYYANRFNSATEVGRYVARNLDRLRDQTRRWHDTYYDATLPNWLLDRVGATVCNLATNTCQWWQNGRFWAWEGVGCCHGTCGHVWNYEHALARLFPQLERSVRTMQDFAPGVGFDAESGAIGFRGEGWTLWAGDSQGGYVLKAYREHQCSADGEFLNNNWSKIRKAVQFLIDQDGDSDGLIEGRQHQTYDQDYFGANTFVGSLYLGALRAAEEMAREVDDPAFAERCRKIFESGREKSATRLFNGEYYIQDVDLTKHPDWQYAQGCLADQMFGQGWAHQVGLGYLYPQDTVLKSLESIWKYNWAPDVAVQNDHHQPERWFAVPGEAGLFTCTWPKSKHLGPKSTRYRNEMWTGIEYQVANHMAWEGMLTECLAICRAVHERYHPANRNPFNEIECGDHYARAMASWGVLTSLAGFECHGPLGQISFAPRFKPEDFKSVFTAAEGWGSFAQQIDHGTLSARLEVQWGRLHVNSLSLTLPPDARLTSAAVKLARRVVNTTVTQDKLRVTLQLDEGRTIQAEDALEVTIQFA